MRFNRHTETSALLAMAVVVALCCVVLAARCVERW